MLFKNLWIVTLLCVPIGVATASAQDCANGILPAPSGAGKTRVLPVRTVDEPATGPVVGQGGFGSQYHSWHKFGYYFGAPPESFTGYGPPQGGAADHSGNFVVSTPTVAVAPRLACESLKSRTVEVYTTEGTTSALEQSSAAVRSEHQADVKALKDVIATLENRVRALEAKIKHD